MPLVKTKHLEGVDNLLDVLRVNDWQKVVMSSRMITCMKEMKHFEYTESIFKED